MILYICTRGDLTLCLFITLGVERARGVPRGHKAPGAKACQQCRKYFLQYSAFASERVQVQTWGLVYFPPPPGAIWPLYATGKSEDNFNSVNKTLGGRFWRNPRENDRITLWQQNVDTLSNLLLLFYVWISRPRLLALSYTCVVQSCRTCTDACLTAHVFCDVVPHVIHAFNRGNDQNLKSAKRNFIWIINVCLFLSNTSLQDIQVLLRSKKKKNKLGKHSVKVVTMNCLFDHSCLFRIKTMTLPTSCFLSKRWINFFQFLYSRSI